MLTLIALAVYVFAAARLTRIITTDKVGEPLRSVVVQRLGTDSMIAYQIHCPWCLGFWICGVLAFPAAVVAPDLPWWWAVGLWPAGSYLVGVLARWDD